MKRKLWKVAQVGIVVATVSMLVASAVHPAKADRWEPPGVKFVRVLWNSLAKIIRG